MPELHRTLALAQSRGLTLWTNRVPPPLLEGFESHIQSPAKLHDEVFGRRQMFLDYLKNGAGLPCRGERCGFCPMSGFCTLLERLRAARSSDAPIHVLLTPDDVPLLESSDPGRIRGLAADPADTALQPAVLDFLHKNRIPAILVFHNIPSADDMPDLPGIQAVIAVNRCTAPALLAHGLPALKGVAVSLKAPHYPDLESCCAQATSLKTFFRHFPCDQALPARVIYDTPPCLSGVPHQPLPGLPLFLAAHAPEWELEKITDYYISRKCFYHSLRCRNCADFPACPGLHINYARAYGFGEAAPRARQCCAATSAD